MRSYTSTAVALALDVDPKWVDNVLSRYPLERHARGRQGVARRLTPAAVLTLSVAQDLHRESSMTLARATRLAGALCADPSGRVELADGLILILDRDQRMARVLRRLALAGENAVRAPRGRPPRRRRFEHVV